MLSTGNKQPLLKAAAFSSTGLSFSSWSMSQGEVQVLLSEGLKIQGECRDGRLCRQKGEEEAKLPPQEPCFHFMMGVGLA